MFSKKDGLEDVRAEEPSKQESERASMQASDAESATSKESENQGIDPKDKNPSSKEDSGKGWKMFRWFRNKALKLGEKTSKLKGLKAISLIQNNSVTSRNLVVAAATGGIEHLLNAKAFHCPENSYRLYGYTFLFGTIIILFCVNVLVIGEIWKLTSRRYVKRYHRRGDFIARLIPSLLKACVGPAVWLIVAFLEEDYYLCAKLGPFPSKGNETSERNETQNEAEMKQKIEEEKSHSHVWAWDVLVALVICGTVVVVSKHCFVKDDILMHNNFEYERREALGAMERFKALMNPGAKQEDTNQIKDPVLAEYGGKKKEIKYYKDGVPEKIGRETVDKLFRGHEDWKCGNEWHYIKAFEAFKPMYPRISTGNPLDPWRAVQGDEKGPKEKTTHKGEGNKGPQKKTKNPWEVKDLQPLILLEAGQGDEEKTQENIANQRGDNNGTLVVNLSEAENDRKNTE